MGIPNLSRHIARIKLWALKQGFSRADAEDFSQDCAERFLDGRRDIRTSFRWLLNDYLRANNRPKMTELQDFDIVTQPYEPGDPRVENYLSGLSTEARICTILKFRWGFTGDEIGHVFGCTASNISLILNENDVTEGKEL